jgi:hypothetical protein
LCASRLLAVLSLSAGLNTALCVTGGSDKGISLSPYLVEQLKELTTSYTPSASASDVLYCGFASLILLYPLFKGNLGSKPPPPALLIANGCGCSLQAQQKWTKTAENSRSAAAPWIRAPASSLHVASAGIEGVGIFLSQPGVQEKKRHEGESGGAGGGAGAAAAAARWHGAGAARSAKAAGAGQQQEPEERVEERMAEFYSSTGRRQSCPHAEAAAHHVPLAALHRHSPCLLHSRLLVSLLPLI